MKRFALALLLAGLPAFAQSFDWPQWQGPSRTAVSKEPNLLQSWPKDGPPLAWKVSNLGGGYSAPAISNGKIYALSYRDNQEVAFALNEADGKTLWTVPVGPTVTQQIAAGREGSGCTPFVDGDKLYIIGIAGDVMCLNAADGKTLWKRSFTKDFDAPNPRWFFRESLLVDGDKVICTPGGKGACIVALNKLTGETIWKSAVPGDPGACYSSVIAFEFEGVKQYAQLTAKTLVGISATDGKFLWKFDKPASDNGTNCSSPVYQDGIVLASSAYDKGAGAVKLAKNPDGSITATEVYYNTKLQNHHGGMIIVDGALYGANGGTSGGYLVCIDFKTGQTLWDEGAQGKRRVKKGSLAFADGRLYYYTEEGDIVLIEPSKTDYIERGRFTQPDRSKFSSWTHPVIANGKLFIRDQENLFCYDIKAK